MKRVDGALVFVIHKMILLVVVVSVLSFARADVHPVFVCPSDGDKCVAHVDRTHVVPV